ncbi:hypothetical protein Pla52n_69720 [Stieleria varia]|uniref:Uncharacterized protein n=1 Tax=Stieleria varia TaxID=2528005 RepID=A0A5C5ZL18_9BACT|nr:hypothetical protein Pla52n_69720 [Stieleria varia]
MLESCVDGRCVTCNIGDEIWDWRPRQALRFRRLRGFQLRAMRSVVFGPQSRMRRQHHAWCAEQMPLDEKKFQEEKKFQVTFLVVFLW